MLLPIFPLPGTDLLVINGNILLKSHASINFNVVNR